MVGKPRIQSRRHVEEWKVAVGKGSKVGSSGGCVSEVNQGFWRNDACSKGFKAQLNYNKCNVVITKQRNTCCEYYANAQEELQIFSIVVVVNWRRSRRQTQNVVNMVRFFWENIFTQTFQPITKGFKCGAALFAITFYAMHYLLHSRQWLWMFKGTRRFCSSVSSHIPTVFLAKMG
ncbi:hypothetical protein BJ165DRAFT_1409168 [Panaeolus papilionaceus]|nr:hypothetical protein BJ165DRAFT_1409168 [Panaeolus papilionaceus]